MDPVTLGKKGLHYLKRGDLSRPIEWIMGRVLFGNIWTVEEGVDPPAWLTTESPIEILKTVDREYPRFYSAIQDDERIGVDPSHPFEALEFQLIDVRSSDRIVVEASWQTEGGESKTTTMTFSDGQFNRLDCLPFEITFDEPATSADLSVSSEGVDRSSLLRPFAPARWKTSNEPLLSTPSVRSTRGENPPIFLISVDSVRFDFLEAFAPVLDALGPDAVVPTEPRTQGHWTRPSHASMITGVHPAKHGYVIGGREKEDINRIDPSLQTLAEFLQDRMYKCSACVATETLGGEYGFSRGFHRFEHKGMSWYKRKMDARDVVDTASTWLADDTTNRRGNDLFYFLHIYDPHYPYIPPFPIRSERVDLSVPERFRSHFPTKDYMDVLENDPPDIPDDQRETVLSFYEQSLAFVAEQLTELIQSMKDAGVFQESFVIILGDHGEEFYERKFALHTSLYDANIRPGMIIKPPASYEGDVPDEIDFIDIFPTIADMVGWESLDQCDGRPMGEIEGPRPRITERLDEDWYNVAVELDGEKAVLTYESNFPRRPSTDRLDSGPVHSEFYELAAVRDGEYANRWTETPKAKRERFLSVAEQFITERSLDTGQVDATAVQPSRSVLRQLERLGYK